MKRSAAIALSKTALKLNRLTGSGGTALPGLVAKKFEPDILRFLADQNFPKGVIVVTGTNGKTTTSRLIAEMLEASGVTYVHNRAGSNLDRGIIAAILEKSDSKGKCQADMGLFEVDEAYVPIVCEQLRPSYLVVTNLFRDQLDRYGELDRTASRMAESFRKLNAKLILNADDPLVANLGMELKDQNRVLYFGISDYKGPKTEHDYAVDSIFDPKTGDLLKYSQRYFGHLGKYKSQSSDFKRPNPQVELVKMTSNSQNGSKFEVRYDKAKLSIDLPLGGAYNIYNALAAIAVASTVGLPGELVKKAIAKSTAAFGRMEEVGYSRRRMLLLLIKNPTGFNQVIQTYLKPNLKATLWIIINDNIADGRDVSWLWDTGLEDISNYEGPIVVSGTRAYDMALRLEYANIDKDVTIVPELEAALKVVVKKSTPGAQINVLPTYTAMLELRKRLVKGSAQKEFWQ